MISEVDKDNCQSCDREMQDYFNTLGCEKLVDIKASIILKIANMQFDERR